MALSRTEEIGRVLADRYRIIAPIGRGASAQVFLADDVRLRRRVAVKMLHDALADDAAFLRRFQAEARAAAALNHPNVMAVYDWGQDPDGDVPFLVLEYLAGGSLRAMLDRGDTLTPSQTLLVGLEATRALEYAHRRGFVHRDIKPANLLFGEEGRLRIADFGLARALAEAAWTEPQGAVLGTARYASPEQAQGKALTGKADVYSLALVLVEAVTGQVPFTADTTIGTLMARVDRDLEVGDELGPLRSALQRAGRSDPDERIDAHGLAVALMAAAGDMPRPTALPLAGAVEADGPTDDPDPTTLAAPSAIAAPPLEPTTVAEPEPEPETVAADDPEPGDSDQPATEAVEDDLDAWPFLNTSAATAATAATVVPEDVDLDLTMAELTEDRTAALGTTVAVPPPVPAVPAPGAGGDGPDGDEPAYVAPKPERPKRSWKRWTLIALVLLLLVAVGVSAGALVADLTATPEHDVPAVVGLDVDAAREKLAASKWTIVEERTREDGTDPGEVLEVTPEAGTSLREGERVTLLVSDGPTMSNVPADLAGQPVGDATKALEDLGFEVSTTADFNEDVEKDRVIGLAEDTLMRQPKGETISLVVSKGPEPRTIPEGLPGKTKEQAVADINALQLVPEVREDHSETVEKGVVIGTDPGAGAEVERGGTVLLVVSKGPPLVKVPNVSKADSVAEANRLLRQAGLVPGEVSGNSEGTPWRTDPPAGTAIPKGSTVDLILRGGGGN